MLLHFALPIDEHAIRRDHEEMLLSLGCEMTHRRQDLHGLTQAHVVAEQDTFLADDILRPELLVTAQGGREQAKVDLGGLDRIGDLSRQATAEVRQRQRAFGDRPRRQQALQERDERSRVIGIAAPDHLRIKGQPLGVICQPAGLRRDPAELRRQCFAVACQIILSRNRKYLIAEAGTGLRLLEP